MEENKIKFIKKEKEKKEKISVNKSTINRLFCITFAILFCIAFIWGLILLTNSGFFENPSERIFGINLGEIVGKWVLNIAAGLLAAVLSAILLLFYGIITPVMNAFQDAIFILLSGKIITSAIDVSYLSFMKISSIIFLIMLAAMIIIAIIAVNTDRIFLRVIKATLSFVFLPFLFWGLFSLAGYMSLWLNDSYFNDTSIADIVASFTFENGFSFGTGYSGLERFCLDILGIMVIIFILKYFMTFCISLAVRVYEVVAFGVLGIIFASSGMVHDNGKRLSTYNSVILTKIFNALLCIVSYLFFLNFLPYIIDNINKTHFDTTYSSDAVLSIVLSSSVVIGSFILLKSLSTEYAFAISGDAKGALATQLNQVNGTTGQFIKPFKQATNMGLAAAKAAATGGTTAPLEIGKKIGKKIAKEGVASAKDIAKKSANLEKSYTKDVLSKSGNEREQAEQGWLSKYDKDIKQVSDSKQAKASVGDHIQKKINNTKKPKE